MRLLDRYLFRELLTPLAYCLGGFLIFWISFDLFNQLAEMQERKLHLLDVIEYCVAMTPEFLVTILPVVLLLALLYTLNNHARHNEITAMRAAGVSLWRLCVPYFIVGLAASAIYFLLNEFLVPRSKDWSNHIMARYVQKSDDPVSQNNFPDLSFNNTHGHRSWMIGEYHVKTGEMLNPQMNWTLPDGSLSQLNADRGIRTNGVWTFFNVREFVQAAGPNSASVPSLRTNILAMPDFDETPKQIKTEIAIIDYQNLRNKNKVVVPLTDIWNYLKFHPDLSRADSSKLRTEFDSRLAAPWTCLVVVLIAIPFGTPSGRRNPFFGVAGSIFICFSYFVIEQVSQPMGASGFLPAWLAAWLPNIIFGATGLWLTARVR
jgi:lipopolysaccharide export system permease protein